MSNAEDVLREKEQVRQILASAAALQAETSQSEWSEDDDDDDLSYDDDDDDIVDDDPSQSCQDPLLVRNHNLLKKDDPASARKLNNRRHRFNLSMMSDRDAESAGYTTDDAALENLSLYNDAGLTDAEGPFILIKFHFFFIHIFYSNLHFNIFFID